MGKRQKPPRVLRFFYRPLILISLGLHGLILMLPFGEEKPPQKTDISPEDLIKITQLSAPSVSTSPPKNSPPKPEFSPQPEPSPKPRSTQPNPVFSPTKSETKTSTPSTPEPEATPETENTPPPGNNNSPPANSPPPVAGDPFKNFPHYPNAIAGSLGLLTGDADSAALNTADPLDKVADFYAAEIPKNGFNPVQISQDGSDVRVLKVTVANTVANGDTQFLHLTTLQGKTVIIMAPQEIANLADLRNVALQSPEERAFNVVLAQVVKDLNLGQSDAADVANVDSNFTPESYRFWGQKVDGNFPDTQLVDHLQQLLEQNNFELAAIPEGDSKRLYQAQQNGFSINFYLVRVPEGDRIATAILTPKGTL